MGKKYLLSAIIVFFSVFTYAQNYDLDLRWKVIDTPVIFPDNFTDWIKRNIGEKYSGFNNLTNKPFGQIIQTDQSKHFIDFNKDGKKDIVLELKFRGYMSDSVLEARQQFYKGIFIAQPNGKYLLDTNFIITGRGYENGGEFGDFDGDGNLDYINIIANYHGKQEWKPLDLYKYGNNLSPSIVNMNNGKSFVQMELDVNPEFFSSSGVLVSDLDNDTNDEIILSVSEKFVIYKYNKSNKSFERKVLNLNNKLTQAYGRIITWINEPMIDKTHFISIISFNNNFSAIGVSDLAVIKIDLNQDNYEVLNILKQPSYTWPDGQFSVAGFHTGPFYKYYDLDKDGKDEFIMIGAPGRELNGSQYYGERMGINVFKNNDNVTANFYNIDTLDNLPKGYFGKLNNSIVIFPWSNGLNAVIKVDTATFNKYSYVYYRFDNGKFIRKKMVFDVKHNPLPFMDTWNLADDFNNDGLTDLFIAHPDDLRNNKLLIPVYCNPQKPSFNTNRTSFVAGDSLKLTISNANKGDTLKWYYGTKSDLTNVSSKTFTDSTKLFVTRTDSIGCLISSDTIKITTYPKLQITTKLRTFKYNLNTYKDAAPNIFLKMHQSISQTVLYTVKGVEHIVTIPVDSVPNAPIHFINRTGNWDLESFYPNFKMDGARNYSFIDTLGNFAYSNHGSEVPKPLPLGDLVVVNTINDTLKWTKVDSVKAFYHAVGTGDLNGDGLVDVVGVHLWSHYWPEGVHPFLQNKNGTYSEARNLISKSVYENRCGSGAVLITDILGDKTPEIIRGSYGYTGATGEIKYAFQILSFDPSTKQFINAYEPKNLGMFSYTSYGGQNATSMKTADFDNNGFKDLAICSEGVLPTGKNGSIIQIWLNNGKGEFIPDQYIMNNADDSLSVREFEVADIDNDGWPDIVMHGNGGVTYRGKLPNSNYGHFFKLNNLIWKNNKGVFDIIPNQLNVYDSTNIELIGNSNFLKGFMVNGKLKYIGFESADAVNPTKLYEITVNFCNNLTKPSFSSTKYSFCSGDSLKLTVSNINKGDTLKWYYGTKSDLTNPSNKTFTDSTKLFVTRTDSLGCVISSDTIQIKKYSIPSAPTLSRDTANFLLSGASSTTWYKDGSAITDTAQKYKPTAAGSYTAKTTLNGCTSVLSAAYYYLVTDIINLSKDEYIKLAPNPFINQLNFDFIVKGYQRLNIEVYDIATGTKVASQPNLIAGSRITLGQLSGGTYMIRVTSNDQKIVQHFKVVKM